MEFKNVQELRDSSEELRSRLQYFILKYNSLYSLDKAVKIRVAAMTLSDFLNRRSHPTVKTLKNLWALVEELEKK